MASRLQTAGIPAAKADNYESDRGARAYRDDHQSKLHRKWSDQVERRILTAMLDEVGPVDTLLDVPCGHGRLFDLFSSHAGEVVAGDWSPSMLRTNRDDHDAAAKGYVRCSALQLPFASDAVDVVVSIRLSHHLEHEFDREAHVEELCRVARKAVILTFFSHTSLKNTLRRLRRPFDGKRPKHTLRRTAVAEAARGAGFVASRFSPLSRLGSGHVFALLTRPEHRSSGR